MTKKNKQKQKQRDQRSSLIMATIPLFFLLALGIEADECGGNPHGTAGVFDFYVFQQVSISFIQKTALYINIFFRQSQRSICLLVNIIYRICLSQKMFASNKKCIIIHPPYCYFYFLSTVEGGVIFSRRDRSYTNLYINPRVTW